MDITLHQACRDGNLEKVKEIIAKEEVDPNLSDEEGGGYPLDIAREKDHPEIVCELIRYGGEEKWSSCFRKTIIWASAREHFDVLEEALKEGGNPDAYDSDSWTPLVWICPGRHCRTMTEEEMEAIKLLLYAGADPYWTRAYRGTTDILGSFNEEQREEIESYIKQLDEDGIKGE